MNIAKYPAATSPLSGVEKMVSTQGDATVNITPAQAAAYTFSVMTGANVAGALGYNPAHAGANSDITSLSGLTTPLAAGQGGTGNTSGTVAALTTGRTLAITGDLAWTSPSFNGASNVTAAGTLATVNSNTGSFGGAATFSVPSFTVNGKGLITAASAGTIPTMVGDTGSGGTKGLVPAPPAGSAAGNDFLRADGTWAVPTVAGVASFLYSQSSGGSSWESLTSSTWTQRYLNTSSISLSSASLSGNQIILPAGSYIFFASAPAYSGSSLSFSSRLRNTTAGTTLAVSQTYRGSGSASGGTFSFGGINSFSGTFTLSVSSVLEIDTYSGGNATGGYTITSGENEIGTIVTIYKIA